MRIITIAAAALLSIITASAQTHQFRASEFDNANGTWRCVSNPSVALASTHPKTNGWTRAVQSSGAVWFGNSQDGASTSPLEFAAAHTGVVKQAFIVLVCDSSAPLSTILSAPSAPLRFAAANSESWFAPEDSAAARELGEAPHVAGGEISVNARATNILKPAPRKQLVAVTFENETPLARVYVGNAAGSPRWKRVWNSGIAEMLFFAEELDENQSASVLKYLSIKHKLGLPAQSAVGPSQTLARLGVRHDGVFATIILVR